MKEDKAMDAALWIAGVLDRLEARLTRLQDRLAVSQAWLWRVIVALIALDLWLMALGVALHGSIPVKDGMDRIAGVVVLSVAGFFCWRSK